MRKTMIISALALALVATVRVQGQESHEWANFQRYSEANEQLGTAPELVLFGDSITDNWLRYRPEFFTENNFAGRGISGQCTSQMIVRFRKDVIELGPKYVAILAGINDLALNEGYSSLENAFGNIVSMCELALAHEIKPIICSMPPADHFSWRPEVKDALEQITEFNRKLETYAKENNFKFVDYASSLADESGVTSAQYSSDSVHPNVEGYAVMEALLLDALKKK